MEMAWKDRDSITRTALRTGYRAVEEGIPQ